LPEQQDLQQRMRAELQVRKHPQFLDCGDRQVLRLVHHQQHATTRAGFVLEMCFDRGQRRSLVLARHH
jgi:hypothetical protein